VAIAELCDLTFLPHPSGRITLSTIQQSRQDVGLWIWWHFAKLRDPGVDGGEICGEGLADIVALALATLFAADLPRPEETQAGAAKGAKEHEGAGKPRFDQAMVADGVEGIARGERGGLSQEGDRGALSGGSEILPE
jgi:hypothetical protein